MVVYPHDHSPAHVHVIGHGCEAVFNLNCPSGPAALRENYRFSLTELGRIQHELNENLGKLCKAWEGIHGTA